MNSSYSSKVTAVVAGLALAGGLAVAAPQAAYAADGTVDANDAAKLEQLVAQTVETASERGSVVYEANTTYEAPVAKFSEADSNGEAEKPAAEEKIEESTDATKSSADEGVSTGEFDVDDDFGVDTGGVEDSEEAEYKDVVTEYPVDGKTEWAGDEEDSAADRLPGETYVDNGYGVQSETQSSISYNKNSWTKVGDKYYWSDDGKSARKGWLVTATATSGSKGELQRYWLTSDGSLAISSLIDAKDAGYWAYATKYGYVVRGKYTEGNNIYLADNDGRLENTGWLVTGNYTNGELERYYIESSTHSAVKGRSTSGYAHYTTSEGYVVRGSYDDGNGRVWLADNDGKLESQTGWLVTGKYSGGELQRYYMNSGSTAGSAKSSRFTAKINNKESVFFGQGGTGYVVRGYGLGISPSDYLYSDNEGRLTSSSWLVTGYWTGGELQRYWFDSTGTVARNRRISQSETKSYAAYATSNGYVVRGSYDDGNGRVWLADNDGRLESATGWLVTGKYSGGELQRYYMNSGATAGSAKSSYFTATIDGKTSTFFGQGGVGYVMRGTLTWGDHVMLADNEGRLETQKGWLVTGKYTNGELQRYYMETISGLGNTLGAKTGYFNVGENKYYGISGVGYVVRGSYRASSGEMVYADNDGVIITTLVGIDIHPDFQAGIDLVNIEADFVIIKISQGTTMDLAAKAKKLADAALSAGKKVGFYHFVDTSKGAVAEADYFSNLVGSYAGKAVLVLDWENNDVTGQKNLNAGPSYAKTWLDRVYAKTGVKALIYMNRSATQSYDWSSVASSGYKLWVAQYLNKYYYYTVNGHIANPDTASGSYGAWDNYGGPTIYQYSDNGRLSGYSGALDMDVFYGNRNMWDQLAKKC